MTPFNIPPLALSHTLVFALYCVFGIGYHVANGKSYRHHWALPAHVSAGVAELVLYAVGRQISPIAVLLCFIQSATNLALTKHLQKGIPALTSTFDSTKEADKQERHIKLAAFSVGRRNNI